MSLGSVGNGFDGSGWTNSTLGVLDGGEVAGLDCVLSYEDGFGDGDAVVGGPKVEGSTSMGSGSRGISPSSSSVSIVVTVDRIGIRWSLGRGCGYSFPESLSCKRWNVTMLADGVGNLTP